ncbi:hypothetical protein BGZ51_009045 [Haplosporangium sp. Z 767]|nr:hypothetical protein BGZ51_009045 [Haplosporangium sp. Z 767]KAF9196474.1 hypothetical protein BGZ50_000094 [Haplosporangium sp. Z 11]
MIAPVQNQLAKSMLTHIGIALTLGGGSAYYFWYRVSVPGRLARQDYVAQLHANRA